MTRPVTSVVFQLDEKGLQRIIDETSGPVALAAAERGLQWARDHAPHALHHRHDEIYAESFEIGITQMQVSGKRRDVGYLDNLAEHAMWVEWGNGGIHLLARAVDAIEGRRA